MGYLPFILIFVAAACNAVMDKLDHHFSASIFDLIKNKKIRLWFNSNQGWRNKYVDRNPKKGRVKWNILGIKINKPVQLTDAWHFFKMLMIFAICGMAAVYPVIIYMGIINWVILGLIWNITFRLFYSFFLTKAFWGKK